MDMCLINGQVLDQWTGALIRDRCFSDNAIAYHSLTNGYGLQEKQLNILHQYNFNNSELNDIQEITCSVAVSCVHM